MVLNPSATPAEQPVNWTFAMLLTLEVQVHLSSGFCSGAKL
jgi:hypothetical protein